MNRLSGSLEAKADILVPPLLLGGDLLAACNSPLHEYPTVNRIALVARTTGLRVLEDVLLLESLLDLAA